MEIFGSSVNAVELNDVYDTRRREVTVRALSEWRCPFQHHAIGVLYTLLHTG